MRVHNILFAFSFVFSAHSIYAQQFTPNGSSLYYNGGNVGIGNASPNTLLEIKKDIAGGLGPVFRLTGGGFGGAQCAIDLATYDPGTNLPAGRIMATDNGNYSCNFDFETKRAGAMGNPMESRMFITADGLVGIGTTNPACKFHSLGNLAASTDDALSGFVQLWADNAIIWKNGNNNGGLRFGNANNLGASGFVERMRISDNGNVGIGTSVPGALLHVVPAPAADAGIQFNNAINGYSSLIWASNNVGFGLIAGGGLYARANAGYGLSIGNSAVNTSTGAMLNVMGAGATSSSYSVKVQNNSSSDVFTIRDDGNVGIATASPSEKLEVNGNIKTAGFVLPTGAGTGKVLMSDANGNATWQPFSGGTVTISGWALNGTSVGAVKSIGTVDNYDLPIITNNTERMRVFANGSVAIGTSSLPSSDALLAVKGNIYTQKVKVTSVNWSDYVFEPGYKLRPLSEVENYIQQQHHLPEVPSAQEVQKDGLDVGDNQATLLKKIEELTLYVIEQQKQIKELKEEVERIKNTKK